MPNAATPPPGPEGPAQQAAPDRRYVVISPCRNEARFFLVGKRRARAPQERGAAAG